jgi:hypothetical protein
VFGNWVLRKIFGPLRDELTGDCWILCDEELHILYSSTNIICMFKSRRMRWTRHVAHNGGDQICIQDFGGETCGKGTIWKT